MTRPAPDGPLTAAETDALLAPLAPFSHVALAVSGGGDSMALMELAAEWRARTAAAPSVSVLTVDHRLRSASADECRAVAARAAALGLACEILPREGPPPCTAIQASARAARRALLLAAARRIGAGAIALAHQRDDQAETVLMRLAHGSGPRGLAGMAPAVALGGVTLLRPFLAVPGARLRQSLAARGLAWIDDPSNADPRFDRVRWRRLAPDLAALGLDGARLVDFARRMGRLDAAAEAETARLVAAHVAVDPDHPGSLRFELAAWHAAPEEIRLRWLRAAIVRVAARPEPPAITDRELVRLAAALATPPARRTLGGAIVSAGPRYVRLAAEGLRRHR